MIWKSLVAIVFVTANALAVDMARVDEKVAIISQWGKDPALVAAVKEVTAKGAVTIDQAQWEKLTILDPKVREYQSNKVGAWLKGKKEPWVSEAFVSVADGTKAGFLTKTTSFSHKGKPKHDQPMAGSTWKGQPEIDQSTGKEQIQVAVPILDGTTPIGSLVVGLETAKL